MLEYVYCLVDDNSGQVVREYGQPRSLPLDVVVEGGSAGTGTGMGAIITSFRQLHSLTTSLLQFLPHRDTQPTAPQDALLLEYVYCLVDDNTGQVVREYGQPRSLPLDVVVEGGSSAGTGAGSGMGVGASAASLANTMQLMCKYARIDVRDFWRVCIGCAAAVFFVFPRSLAPLLCDNPWRLVPGLYVATSVSNRDGERDKGTRATHVTCRRILL